MQCFSFKCVEYLPAMSKTLTMTHSFNLYLLSVNMWKTESLEDRIFGN